MKVCVVTPFAEYVNYAGARIRYRRIMEPLRRLGHELSLTPVTTFDDAGDITDDIYVLSKCHDAGALLVALRARGRGSLVGIDLFDDYLSQVETSRISHLRCWWLQALATCDFVLCSTPAMRSVASRFAPGMPAHVMNDPCLRIDADDLARRLALKHDRLQASRCLQVAWFGMGDNPYFPAGLLDLVAFGDELARLRTAGLDARLRILTNRRSMTPDMLAALTRLPLSYTIDEWSEPAEAEVLADSDVAFLPVTAQPFSVAKSLNRGITALCAGAQILSVGYPLYERLDPLVYRDAAELARDAVRGRLRLRAETVGDMTRRLADVADPDAEAAGLAGFLSAVTNGARKHGDGIGADMSRIGVVHGHDDALRSHTLARRLGAISIGTPFSRKELDYDVLLRWNRTSTALEVLVRKQLWGRLSNLITASAGGGTKAAPLARAGWIHLDVAGAATGAALSLLPSPTARACGYSLVLAECARMLDQAFGGLHLILSQDWQMGFALPGGFADSPWTRS